MRKAADAYEMLGLIEEKNRVLEKYGHLFSKSSDERQKKSRKARKVAQKVDDKAGRLCHLFFSSICRAIKLKKNSLAARGPKLFMLPKK